MKRTMIAMVMALMLAGPVAAQKVPVKDDPSVASSLRLLEQWVASQIAYRGQPGVSMGIVHGGKLIWAKGFGVSDLAARTPATPRTIYRIASITKLFTSTALLQLRDAGKLGLDDPVVKFIPGFRVGDPFPDDPPITVRNLLTHTSGITSSRPSKPSSRPFPPRRNRSPQRRGTGTRTWA
jgi:CubicO group peptidase (beta-lactamase class C family)